MGNLKLKLNDDGKWEIDGIEIIAGDIIWLNISGVWVSCRIERNGNQYHAVPITVQLESGMEAEL